MIYPYALAKTKSPILIYAGQEAGNREGVGTVDQAQGLGNDLGKNLGAHNGIHGQRHIAQGVEDGGGDQTAEHEHHEERAEDAQPDGPAEADNEGSAEDEGGSGDQHIMCNVQQAGGLPDQRIFHADQSVHEAEGNTCDQQLQDSFKHCFPPFLANVKGRPTSISSWTALPETTNLFRFDYSAETVVYITGTLSLISATVAEWTSRLFSSQVALPWSIGKSFVSATASRIA